MCPSGQKSTQIDKERQVEALKNILFAKKANIKNKTHLKFLISSSS